MYVSPNSVKDSIIDFDSFGPGSIPGWGDEIYS